MFHYNLCMWSVLTFTLHCFVIFVPSTDVTNVSGRLVYWIEWGNGGKFVESHDAVSQWPRLVKDFLEPRLTFGMPSGLNRQIGGKRRKADDYEPDFYVGSQMGKYCPLTICILFPKLYVFECTFTKILFQNSDSSKSTKVESNWIWWKWIGQSRSSCFIRQSIAVEKTRQRNTPPHNWLTKNTSKTKSGTGPKIDGTTCYICVATTIDVSSFGHSKHSNNTNNTNHDSFQLRLCNTSSSSVGITIAIAINANNQNDDTA